MKRADMFGSMRWAHRPSLPVRSWMAGVLLVAAGAVAAQGTDKDGLAFALREATTAHPLVRAKLGELGALGFQIEEAEAARYPSLSAEARSRTDTSGRGLLRLTQPLWAFGRIDKKIEVARQREQTGRLELLEVRRRLMEDTAAAYNQVLTQRDRLRIAQLNVNEHADLLALISRRSDGGLAAPGDVRLAQLRLAQANLAVRGIQGALEKAQQDLQTYTQATVPANQPFDSAWLKLPARQSLQQMADEQAASVQVRRERLQSLARDLELQRLEVLPTLSARIDKSLSGPAGNASDARVTLVLEGRLDGAGLVGSARVKALAVRLEAAHQEVDAARVEARQRLGNLLSELELQLESITAQTVITQATRDTMDSNIRQYDAGRKSWLDLLNTQKEMADARQQLEIARGSWREQSVRIAVMLGLLDELSRVSP